ncbi:thiamine diphosphokinase [Defluviimonas sp. WL0075]|uniref:Thiamine diphosphokinase n=1 Tax=Albidovulum sediminicola TaxID=2984331 RepID=A0ABT2Z2Q9_9RHOB|nr:thiamine diphosphokinase [Defluviimonas sp. WL0075]MCV2865433.1 thiamine diphosphokinase [Defluviimonas sp. WL0075]
MTPILPHFSQPVTLLGGGEVDREAFAEALLLAPQIVAADGGANVARAFGQRPEWVIGDLDSADRQNIADLDPSRVLFVAEQETTDFEKCLMRVRAPFLLGLGFTGLRFDHSLAACNALVRHPGQACLLVGRDDVIFHAPPRLSLDLVPGTRVSLFPMTEITGRSEGLRWPIAGLTLAPGGRIGTSNEAMGRVTMAFDTDGMLVILPRAALRAAIAALRPGFDAQAVPAAQAGVRGR